MDRIIIRMGEGYYGLFYLYSLFKVSLYIVGIFYIKTGSCLFSSIYIFMSVIIEKISRNGYK